MIVRSHIPPIADKTLDIEMNRGLQELLLRHWLFGCLPGNEIANLSHQFTSRRYAKGTYVFHQNDPAEFLFVILEGEVSIESISAEGKLTNIAHLNSGDIFGEFALIDSKGRSASACMVTDSIVASLSGVAFKRLLRDHASFSEKLLKVLVSRVRAVNQHMECLITLNLLQRTARLLLTLSDLGGSEIKITQSDLGSRLHASREKVNSKLKELEKKGAINCGHGKISIVDREKLRNLLESI